MATHDYIISNASGAAVRADLNNALAAIVSNNSSATAPATTYAYMWWADTGSSPPVLKIRNAANTNWITLFQLDGEFSTIALENGTAAAPSLYFKDSGTDTGLYSPGADEVAITTAGTGRVFVNSSGNVGIGTTSPLTKIDSLVNTFADDSTKIAATFRNNQNSGVYSVWQNSNTGTTFGDGLHIGLSNTSNGIINLKESADLQIQTASTERARIDSSGRLLVGTSTARANFNNTTDSAQFQVEGTTPTARRIAVISSENTGGAGALILAHQRSGTIGGNTVLQNNDAVGSIAFDGSDGTEFVRAGAIDCIVDGTPGANDMPGRLIFSTTAAGASSPTERMRITRDGEIRLANSAGINISSSTDTGVVVEASGTGIVSRAGNVPLFVMRQTNDGTLIEFRQAGSAEGTISVSGTTVSYNGAHLSRWSQLPGIDPHDKEQRPEILRGTVMSNLDEMCDWTCPTSGECQDNEQLNKTKVSDVEGDKNVAGVFQSWDDDDDTWVNDFYLAMTGDMVIRIAEGVTVERGDLLMSAGDGTAKPQDDDIIRSKTIAKVTSTNVSCTYDDGSYCVPCVLMAC